MRIDPSDLGTFLAIARHRSFRAAATELGVSASALSHALRNIEERLDLRLINRTTRSVALTEAGERLFARISPAFRDIDDALEDLNSFRGKPAGTLRFNAARQSTQLVLLPIVTRFLKSYPEVNVEIVVNDALVDTVAAGFDAGVRFGETIAADMIAVPIGPRHRFAVVGAPAYFKAHQPPATPHDLKGLPCIRYRFSGGALYRWEFQRGGIEVDIDVEGATDPKRPGSDGGCCTRRRWPRLRVRGAGGRPDCEAQTGPRARRLVSGLSRFLPVLSQPPAIAGRVARLCRFREGAGEA
jgi:DNA-binding transcriptional LysR family regulator